MSYAHGPIYEGPFNEDKPVWEEGTEYADLNAYLNKGLPEVPQYEDLAPPEPSPGLPPQGNPVLLPIENNAYYQAA